MAFNNSRDIHIARDANNVVHGDQHNYAHSSDEKLLRLLAQNAAPNACYDSEQRFPPPNCHEGTRLQILEMLSKRVGDKSKANSVLWLHGSAGVGKSAIAQHLAEKYAKSGRLAAAFFFSRNDSTRDKISPLVASIAYQFCRPDSPLFTTLAPAIFDAIRSDPNIFHSSCENQVQKLIIKACSNIDTVEQDNPPNVIIIDGLDECINRTEQGRVLGMVRALISHSSSYFSWIILLCSRPEPQIRYDFDRQGFVGHLESFDVNSLNDVNRDIRRYLVDNFATLQTKHQHALGQERFSWPGEHALDQLVSRADGQFIFAATVIKYLDVDDEPLQDRLDIVLRIYIEQGESPYSSLDMLYHQILSSCRKWDKVQPLLRLLITAHFELDEPRGAVYYHPLGGLRGREVSLLWRSSRSLALFLDIQICDVSTLLIRLHSVLRIPEKSKEDQDIQVAHATFTEFLGDRNRSGPFYTTVMSKSEYCDCMAILLLRQLAAFTPFYPLYHLESLIRAKTEWRRLLNNADSLVRLACESWGSYCSEVVSPSIDLLTQLDKFDVHVTITISLHLSLGLPLQWHKAIKWSKAFKNSRFESIVKRLEIAMKEMHIVFYTHLAPRTWILQNTFDTELQLFGNPHTSLRLDFKAETTSLPNDSNSYPFVLPTHMLGQLLVPKGCEMYTMHITRDNADAIRHVFEAFRGSGIPGVPVSRLVLQCIAFGHTPSQDLGLRAERRHLATLLEERMAALSLEWSHYETLVESSERSTLNDSTPSVNPGHFSLKGGYAPAVSSTSSANQFRSSSSNPYVLSFQETSENDRFSMGFPVSYYNSQHSTSGSDSERPVTHSQVCTLRLAVNVTPQPNGSCREVDVDSDRPKDDHKHRRGYCCFQ